MSLDSTPTPNSDFNPYLKWLGIRNRSPDHYQLLGLERFESDADVIVAAADRQMAHVRKYQNGPRSEISQVLLNELASAKICLLTADKKLAYDIRLASEQGDQQSIVASQSNRRWLLGASIIGLSVTAAALAMILIRSNATPPPASQAPTVESTVDPDSTAEIAASKQPPTREGFTESTPDLAGAAYDADVPTVSESARGQIQLVSGDEASPQADGEQQAAVQEAEQKSPEPTPPVQNTEELVPANGASAPLVTVVDAEPSSATDAEADVAASATTPWEEANAQRKRPGRPFAGQETPVAKFLQSLQDRNVEAADQLQQRILAEADNEPMREEARRLELIFFKIKEFWEKVDQGRQRVSVGDVLDYRGVSVTVVQKSENGIRLKSTGGKEKDFDTSQTKIGGDLAVGLARHNGKARGIMLDVMCGVFLSIDRDGDRDQASMFLKRAQENGIPIDVFQATSTSAPRGENSENVYAWQIELDASNETASEAARRRYGVPPADVRKRKLRLLRTVAYQELYRQRGADAQRELANRLFLDANQSADDPDARYVMYTEAIRLAAENGDAKTLDTAIRAVVYNFDCEEDSLRLEGLNRLSRTIREADQAEVAVDSAVKRVRQLILNDQFVAARQYMPALLAVAGRARSVATVQLASELETQLDEVQLHYQQLRRDLFGRSSPDDATANTLLGLYQLHKGNDERGREHLQSSNQQTLVRASVAEQDMDQSPTARLEVADLWWAVAEAAGDDPTLSKIARERAAHWYAASVDGLAGFSKRRAAARSLSHRP